MKVEQLIDKINLSEYIGVDKTDSLQYIAYLNPRIFYIIFEMDGSCTVKFNGEVVGTFHNLSVVGKIQTRIKDHMKNESKNRRKIALNEFLKLGTEDDKNQES